VKAVYGISGFERLDTAADFNDNARTLSSDFDRESFDVSVALLQTADREVRAATHSSVASILKPPLAN